MIKLFTKFYIKLFLSFVIKKDKVYIRILLILKKTKLKINKLKKYRIIYA